MREPLHLEYGVVVLQRVVAVVIAERPLGTAQPRRHFTEKRELGIGKKWMRPAAVYLRQTSAGDQRREHQLRHVLGQRRNCRQDQRRRSAEEDGCGKALPPAFGN